MKILIVDDIQDNLDMLDIILRSHAYGVVSAKNGKEALDKLRKEPFDLIISDILMPVMDGFQLCKMCKADEALRHIPLLFYTATYIDKKDEQFAFSLGASGFLVKPQEPNVILKVVDKILVQKAQFQENERPAPEVPEAETYRMYSERLINKLEKKMHDLEKEIAKRKLVEEELILAKEKAEQSDRLKSAFLANISHEIRTPLNGILGFASLLKEMKPDHVQIAKFVDIIVRSGQRLTSIIADIIEISKLETGQVTVSKEEVPVAALLDSIYDEMAITIPAGKSIKLQKDYSDIPDSLVIQTDRTKLSQILINLISNAIKYTPEGLVTLGASLQGESDLEFFVTDTGIGIHKDYHESIFERFRQVNESSPVFQSGTGLGLAICKSYADLMGGKIRVESVPGNGAKFFFSIPFVPFEQTDTIEQPVIDIHSCDLSGKQILIVEDDIDNFEFMQESLLSLNAKIIWAKNGLDAIEMVNSHPGINLVLMDIRMPVLDGLEATRRILKIRNDLRVVAQTAYAYSDDKVEAFNAGCVDIVTKPFTVQEFIGTICRHIN